MRAVVYERYGSPGVLRVQDVPTPSPAAGQVLVKIAATSINLSDWEALRGSPGYARLGGLRTPRRRTLGSDIAGLVEAVGHGVTRFQPGEEVYGDNLALMGGFASSRILEVHGERMIKRTFDPGFRIELHQKDLSLALAGARALNLSLPNTAATQELFNAAAALGGKGWDHSGLVRVLEHLAGHQVAKG